MKKAIVFTLLGLLGGFLYFHFWGCESGCSIQSSPYLMSLYGGMIGITLGLPMKKKPKENEESLD